MIGKWAPVLLTTASIGGGVWYSLSDNEYKIYTIVTEDGNGSGNSGIYKKDEDVLRKRNEKAFGLDKSKNNAGIAWKASVEGSVFRDETYYVFDDWSFLNGVQIEGSSNVKFSGGENLKSYVDGVGLKVEKINDTWEYKTGSWERKRKLSVKRVLMKGGYQFENGKGTCFLKSTDQDAKDDSNLYLLIGFAKTSVKDNMSKPDQIEFVSNQESFCNNYQNNKYGLGNSKISISFDVINGQITGKEYPVISSINESKKTIRPIYWMTKEKVPVNAVVLAVAIKGKQKSDVDKDGWDTLRKQEAIKEVQKKIKNGEIVERHSKTSTVGFELKKSGGKLKGDTTEGWTSNAEITFR